MLRGHGPAVDASGECTRIMYAGRTEHQVKQAWAPNERGIRLFTTLVDSRAKRGVDAKNTGYCEANEQALSELARKKVDAIMVGKREAARRKGVPQGGGGVGADRDMCCPVIGAIKATHEGSRARTLPTALASQLLVQRQIACACSYEVPLLLLLLLRRVMFHVYV